MKISDPKIQALLKKQRADLFERLSLIAKFGIMTPAQYDRYKELKGEK